MKDSKLMRILLVLAMAILVAGAALANDEAKEETEVQDVKKMDGKELFIAHCKVCHMEDSDAGEYTPMSLIMDQWDEFYDEGFAEAHKEVPSLNDKDKMAPDMFDKKMIKKLRKFCVDHAADSEQPMTCG